jgi:hypothetical protein
MSNRQKQCSTCEFALWAERVPLCPECKNFSEWVKSEPRPAPKPVFLGHHTEGWGEEVE